MASTVKKRRRRLRTGLKSHQEPAATEWVIPVRWLKQLIAVFLIPPSWIVTRAFFSSFSTAAVQHRFWASEEFWFFCLGTLLWFIAFFGLPRPMLLYVFGHELTHAIWTWLMGGKVRQFHVSRAGGYVVTDTNNFWISLAPYFFPLYSVLALLLYGSIGMFVDVEPYKRWLFGVVGFTWCFHATFAIWMLWNGQTDLIEHGTFFSMMVIYLVNFSVLSVMLIVACRDVTFSYFGKELLDGAVEFSDQLLHLVHLKL
ncbi:MAG: hypothetical protein JO066_06050 [Verrucomicrobia bacterium]|nr:hypothetical protein [Verrucomicrobiota bacterium]